MNVASKTGYKRLDFHEIACEVAVPSISDFKFSRFFQCREPEEGEEAVVYEGNQQWEGYSMDLIEAISKILHFQYRFELVPDGE